MDSFTLAVVIGIGIVVAVFIGMILLDKGAPTDQSKTGQ